MVDFSFIDLFAGIGGLRLGMESVGGRCIYTSEWDRFAQQTYRANFPHDEHQIAGDITKIDANEIPPHDVLCAGFPCQPFSIAGVSKKNALGRVHGFRCDAQGTLFFDVARIIEHHRPKFFLLENVKNLTSHDGGRTITVIMRTLEQELPYRASMRVFDARSFVPQHRERLFIVGVRRDLDVEVDLTQLELPDAARGPRLGEVLHQSGRERLEQRYVGPDGSPLPKYVLSDHLWRYLRDYAAKHRAAGNGFGYGLVGAEGVARTLSARYFKDGSEILVERQGRNPRRLTPRECARLMGFDAPCADDFVIPVSDTQAYRQFGNSVVVPVVKAVARHMAPAIADALAAPHRRAMAAE